MTRDSAKRAFGATDEEIVVLLPLYLAGRLDEAERADVEQWMATSPLAERALENARAERVAVTTANEAISPPAVARARLDAALDAVSRQPPTRRLLAHAGRKMLDLLDFGDRRLAWGVAAAMFALVVGQATYLAQRIEPGRYELAGEDRAIAPQTVADATIVFVPDAPMSAVSALLGENGARIVSGPDGGVIWRISIAADHANGSKTERTARIKSARHLVAVFTPASPAATR